MIHWPVAVSLLVQLIVVIRLYLENLARPKFKSVRFGAKLGQEIFSKNWREDSTTAELRKSLIGNGGFRKTAACDRLSSRTSHVRKF